MARQIINLGTADKGNGDPIRTAFGKINSNFFILDIFFLILYRNN